MNSAFLYLTIYGAHAHPGDGRGLLRRNHRYQPIAGSAPGATHITLLGHDLNHLFKLDRDFSPFSLQASLSKEG